jgi:hypothetical protein
MGYGTIIELVIVTFEELFLAFFIGALNNELIVVFGGSTPNRGCGILESKAIRFKSLRSLACIHWCL